jgi:hypothetical protein
MAKDWKQINWSDLNENISDHFKVGEALLLPSWRVYHIPSDKEKEEIVKTADVMEKIRALFGTGISIHCWMRPLQANAPGTQYHNQNYNAFVGSKSTMSAHIFGRAVDFHVNGKQGADQCAQVRQTILPHLEAWNIRMEDIGGAWIHIDTYPVKSSRFFKP